MGNRFAILLALLLLVTGCAPGLVDARAAVNRVSETYAATAPALEKQRKDAGDECFFIATSGADAVRKCIDDVRARWKPVELAMDALYVALVAAQSSVGAAEAVAEVGRKPSVATVMAVVMRLLDAAVRLEGAVDRMRRKP